MLKPYAAPEFSVEDRRSFDQLVPFDHWTRRADQHIDFLALRAITEPYFKDGGRPAIEPILFLKIELLMFHDNLSDRQVVERAQTDMAYRRFLGLGSKDHLPDRSTLSHFRARLGVDGHKTVFHELLGQARSYGLVRDRQRLKDATHILADIAIPAGLQLVAQARNKLLATAETFDTDRVTGERVRIEGIRMSTDSCGNDMRLTVRVEHLRDIVAWTSELLPPDDRDSNPTWQALQKAIAVAREVLGGHDLPDASGKIRSTVDPDARRGKHGDYYDGYFVDVTIDADSELITSVMVLPANGNESADTLTLVEQEQSFHGNQIQQISIDGAGFDGPVIRELESQGIKTFVPPKETTNYGRFTSNEFEFSEDGRHATCPAGQQSQYAQRDEGRHSTSFRFNMQTCQSCPLKTQCIKPGQKHGRSVRRNDYEPEYEMLRQRAATEEYARVKSEHPKVERRLGELINRYGGRRARYRGLARVHAQKFMEAATHNVIRMIRLLDRQIGFAIN